MPVLLRVFLCDGIMRDLRFQLSAKKKIGGDVGQRAEAPILESFDERNSCDGVSDAEGMVDPGVSQGEVDLNVNDHSMSPAIREALVSLDHLDLVHMFSRRAILMKCHLNSCVELTSQPCG